MVVFSHSIKDCPYKAEKKKMIASDVFHNMTMLNNTRLKTLKNSVCKVRNCNKENLQDKTYITNTGHVLYLDPFFIFL